MAGQGQPGKTMYYGLKEGGISLSPMTHTRHKIPGHVLEEIEQVKDRIVSGEIKVGNYLHRPEKAVQP